MPFGTRAGCNTLRQFAKLIDTLPGVVGKKVHAGKQTGNAENSAHELAINGLGERGFYGYGRPHSATQKRADRIVL